MASKSDIANMALIKLGDERVSNIDTADTPSANAIRYVYDLVRDAMLAEFPWNFAVKQASLAKDADAPLWDWGNKYTLPSDFLSLLRIKETPDYRIIDGQIYTNADAPLYIEYIARIVSEGTFDPLFVQAFASRLAYEVVERISPSNTKRQIMADDYRKRIEVAYASDSIQDLPQRLQESEWLLAREGYPEFVGWWL